MSWKRFKEESVVYDLGCGVRPDLESSAFSASFKTTRVKFLGSG